MTTVEAILRVESLDDMVKNGVTSNRFPLEHILGFEPLLTWKRPRIIHTHLRYQELPKDIQEQKAKIIHIMRNPFDVAVSYYHFAKISKSLGYYAGSWETFFDAFMDGQVAWGTWYDHMIDWLKYKDIPNILFIKYEDFLKEPRKMIGCLADFLGRPLKDDDLSKIEEIVSFKSMKSNPKFNFEKKHFLKDGFLRKGTVGDWKNYFTPDQEKRMKRMYQKFTEVTGVECDFET